MGRLKQLRARLVCWFFGHDWTCRAAEGQDPTQAEIDQGVAGFWIYARMYCKRCGALDKIRNR